MSNEEVIIEINVCFEGINKTPENFTAKYFLYGVNATEELNETINEGQKYSRTSYVQIK